MNDLISRFNKINSTTRKSNLQTRYKDSKTIIRAIKEMSEFESLPPRIDYLNKETAQNYLISSICKHFLIDHKLIEVNYDGNNILDYQISSDYLIGLCNEMSLMKEFVLYVKGQSVEIDFYKNGIFFKTRLEARFNNYDESNKFLTLIYSNLREQLEKYGAGLEVENYYNCLDKINLIKIEFHVKKIELLTLLEKSEALKKSLV